MRKPIGLTAPYREDDDDIQEYKKPWVGLTDDDRQECFQELHEHFKGVSINTINIFAKRVEAKLKEKNT